MEDEPLEDWEREVLAGHRWRKAEQAGQAELARLRSLRDAALPLDADHRAVIGQVLGAEICNWALFETIARVCSIIGREAPDSQFTGHYATVTPARWCQIWAYYLACRRWLGEGFGRPGGYAALLGMVDDHNAIARHVAQLLGPPDPLKELFVARFCICLDAWIGDLPPQGHPSRTAMDAAAKALEGEILRQEPRPRVPFEMIRLDDHSILQACHHKLFRRYDIILSSIGDGQWRRSMPMRGTDGEERAAALEPYLAAMEDWVKADRPVSTHPPARDLYERLGRANAFKLFAVSLLASLLRSQQIRARRLAAKRQADGLCRPG